MAPGISPVLMLASASPRRSALLRQIGVAHEVMPAAIEEARMAGERAEICVQRLAQQKAQFVYTQLAGARPTLGADTAVVIDEVMLGKPRDRAEAVAMLVRLSGRAHRVLSAVALMTAAGAQVALSESEVLFRRIDGAECAAYWDSGEPRDKAGGYAIQGLGAVFVARLRGSYSGVMGLPLFETAQLLRAAGIDYARGAGGPVAP
jgi:septum formation protein